MMPVIWFFVFGILGLGILVGGIIVLSFSSIWVRAWMSGAHISFMTLVGMSLRKVSPSIVVNAHITGIKAGVESDVVSLETHILAGGRVLNVMQAMIAADRAQLGLSLKDACAIDLSGRDVVDAVRTSVNPKVIDCPEPQKGKANIAAIAKDGIQLLVKARVTVRTNLAGLIGGATEDTIIARVGQGIVSSIGSSINHKEVLENPDKISKAVLSSGLASGTAFEILSIDIADVDVGENIGAKLQADQAEADVRVARALAEKRRALAVAAEQENQALVMKNKAEVVLAEAEVPHAIAEAFRSGNLGVMDYYKLKNLQADTDMRSSIGEESKNNDE